MSLRIARSPFVVAAIVVGAAGWCAAQDNAPTEFAGEPQFLTTTISGRAALEGVDAASGAHATAPLGRSGTIGVDSTVAVTRGSAGGELLAIGIADKTNDVTLFLSAPMGGEAFAQASFGFISDESGDLLKITLNRGFLSLTSLSDAPAGLVIAAGDGRGFEGLKAAAGQVFVASNEGTVEVAYRGPASVEFRANGKNVTLKSGEMARISGAGVESASASTWIDQNFSPAAVERLVLAGAKEDRDGVGRELFDDIVSWDRRASPQYVRGRIEATRFTPEQRQVNFSVSALNRVTTPPQALPTTVSFEGANEVPPVSPAALSVINIANNVTAIVLNREARQLLTQTGSIGLGFGGLRQLALPGLFGGVRSVGPSGLGANNR